MVDNGNKIIMGLLAVAIIIAVGVFAYYAWWPDENGGETVLTVTYGVDQVWDYTLDDLKNMEAYTGVGGMVTKTDVKEPSNFTGIRLKTLIQKLGIGSNTSIAVQITALDGYSQVFNESAINGFVDVYEPSGNLTDATSYPALILAYEENGVRISDEDGPVRVAFVSESVVYTNSKYWVKQVVQIVMLVS